MVGPKLHAFVPCVTRELQASTDESTPQIAATSVGMDEQDAQESGSGSLRILDAEDAPDALSVDLRDPSRLANRIVTVGVVGDDAGHQRLERRVPAELAGVHLAMGLDDPAKIARFSEGTDCRVGGIGH